MGNEYVVRLDQIGKNDLKKAGGKGANLGELIKIGIPVPEGFVVSTTSFNGLIQEYNLDKQIRKLIERVDVSNAKSLLEASLKLKQTILSHPIPLDVRRNVSEAYKELSKCDVRQNKKSPEEINPALVAVRSSATAEDLPTASFAGQQASFLSVKGEENLFESIRKCWASLYEQRAIFYRTLHGISKASIAVIVQKMIKSEKSGIMFTIDPTTGENIILIEAIWGIGEGIVGGEVSPDLYKVSKEDRKRGTIIDSQISNKTKMKLFDEVSNKNCRT